jgi:hypothetical protein
MTDPKTFAGPCGVGYAVFIAFTRFSGSKVVVLRVQDTNDKDGGDTWVSQGYSILESANNAQNGIFHDLPDAVVDPVRTPTSDPCAHRLYVGWATFTGADGAGKLSFARTTAGDGPTWNPTWQKQVIKTGPTLTNQGVMLAVDPRLGTPNTINGGGTLYYGWRAFATSQNAAGIWLTSSKDFGANFNKNPILVNKTPLQFYDQPTVGRDITPVSEYWAFRSNALPTMQVVPRTGGATIFIGWQERVTFQGCPPSGAIPPTSSCGLPFANGDPRIVITRSFDSGATWSDWLGTPNQRRAVDFGDRDVTPPTPGYGYLPRYTEQEKKSGGQLMPHLTYGGGRLGLFYYEARGPLTSVPIPNTNGLLSGMDRQLDARFALLDPVMGSLAGTNQVSRYPIKFGTTFADGEENLDDIAEVAPGVPKVSKRVNAPNSGNGLKPFIGDYITATPIVQYVFNRTSGLWRWAINPEDVPFAGFRTVFTDSRNVIPAVNNEYQNFVPVGAPGTSLPPACTNAGSRNHDVFHAFVDARVAVNAIATFKQLSGSVDRGFPITVTNGTDTNAAGQPGNRFFRLSFDKPLIASFDQFVPGMDVFDVELLPFSSSTRVAYVTAQNANESVKVFVVETTGLPATPGGDVMLVPNGLSGSVTLNLDPTNDADPGNPNGTVNEDHTPLVSNPLVSNYTPATPLVSNTALNPLVSNPLVSNIAPTPLVSNPLVSNGSLEGEMVYQIIDTTWKVSSGSNVASAVSAAVNVANAQSLDGNYVFQLLIHKTSTSAGSDGCTGGNVVQDQIISSIPNPLVSNPLVSNPLVSNQATNPLVSNATFALAPPAEGGPARARAQMRVSPLAAPAVPPQDETQSDYTSDATFVTLRAYQIVATVPPNVVYNPLTSPAIAVSPQSVDVVNNEEQGDEPPPPGLSFVVTNTNNSGLGSLRQAILNANDATGVDNITFNIPGAGPHTITLASALPTVSDPVVIDATTQPGFAGSPRIVLDGTSAGAGVNGLTITGGLSAVRGLVIRSFGGNGILLTGRGGNLIEGNYIGTDVTGAVDQGNSLNGVNVLDSGGNTIGGSSPSARNLVSGNGAEGVRVDGPTSTGNVIQGNYIGTSASGLADLGNNNSGVYLRHAPQNSVLNNVVSGNDGFAGIAICGNASGAVETTCGGGGFGNESADGNIIGGNRIGTTADGTGALGNGSIVGEFVVSGFGVSIDGASDTMVGGTAIGASNVIANNRRAGVVVFNPPAAGNQIRGNSIFSNDGLGIDLLPPEGVTPNDAGDGDAGSNNLQNFPVIGSVVSEGGSTTISGTLSTTPGATLTIDFYANTACDPTGSGEGRTRVGSATVTTNSDGVALIDSTFTGLTAGQAVTATATDLARNTSEFSNCVPVSGLITFQDQPIGPYPNGTVTISAGGVPVTFSGTGLHIRAITAAGFPPGASRTLSTPSDFEPITAIVDFGEGVTANFVQIRNWISGVYDGEVDTIVMSAYDASNNLLGTVTSSAEFISLAFPGIKRVVFDDVNSTGYVIDEFRFVVEGGGQ